MLQPTALFRLSDRTASLLLLLFLACPIANAQTAKDVARLRQSVMDLEKPTLKDFDAAAEDFKKKRLRNVENTTLFKGTNSNQLTKNKLKAYIEYNFDALTNPKIGEPKKEGEETTPRHIAIEEAARKFLGKLVQTGKLMPPGNELRTHRKYVFDTARDKAASLLDGNYYVRKEAIRILGGLGFRGRDKRLDIYAGSKGILLKVASESPFPELRFHALAGLMRMVRANKIKTNTEQTQIMAVIAADLGKTKDSDAAYGLASLLTSCNTTFGLNGQPNGIIALVRVLTDQKQSFIARAAAAKAIGHTGEPTQTIDWGVLSWVISEFVAEAATEFNRQTGAAGTVNNRVDPAVILDAYFSFQPYTRAAVDAKRGMRYRSSDPRIEAAYQNVLPIAKAALKAAKDPGTQIPAADIDALKKWVEENRPKDRKYHSAAPPVPTIQQAGQSGGSAR